MSYIARVPWDNDFIVTEQMLEWAKKHCPSYITNDAKDGYYQFYFNIESECLFFKLKWL
jgi:hypothetical protein